MAECYLSRLGHRETMLSDEKFLTKKNTFLRIHEYLMILEIDLSELGLSGGD